MKRVTPPHDLMEKKQLYFLDPGPPMGKFCEKSDFSPLKSCKKALGCSMSEVDCLWKMKVILIHQILYAFPE